MRVSAIVPTLQEEATIGACLEHLAVCEGVDEILVCDGGSTDLTHRIVTDHPRARLVLAPPGRAQQMNAGALEATGGALWFVHADSVPPPDPGPVIRKALALPEVSLGAFRFTVGSPRPVFRLLEVGVRVRSEVLGVPYGDQGLFMRRSDFLAAGGYPEVPYMEDLYLVRSLRRRGRVVACPDELVTSARRWEARGFLRTSLRNWGLVVGDWLGMWGHPKPSASVVAAAKRARAAAESLS